MTWKYKITNGGSEMEVYDHTGNKVKTLQNDGGFEIPQDVYEVMVNEVTRRGLETTSEYQTETIVLLASQDIKRKL